MGGIAGYGANTNSSAASPLIGVYFIIIIYGLMPWAMSDKGSVLSKDLRIAQYRERLDQLGAVLKNKYNLFPMTGAVKQISWATDIRTKFLEEYDKHRGELTSDICNAVMSNILTNTESRWWIDRKDMKYEEFISFAKTTSHIKDGHEIDLPNCIVDCIQIDVCDTSKIIIYGKYFDGLNNIITEYKFIFDKDRNYWFRDICVDDNARTGVIESLCLTLLGNGYKIQVLSPNTKDDRHDGILKIFNDRLCVETCTDAIYKVASSIGMRVVYLDKCKKSDIQSFIDSYDIICTNSAKNFIGDMDG